MGLAHEIVPVHARYADLEITGQVDPGSLDVPRRRGLAICPLKDLGRPTMVVPAGMFTSLGNRILVDWNGSREAARALHDAMPSLQQAELVSCEHQSAPAG